MSLWHAFLELMRWESGSLGWSQQLEKTAATVKGCICSGRKVLNKRVRSDCRWTLGKGYHSRALTWGNNGGVNNLKPIIDIGKELRGDGTLAWEELQIWPSTKRIILHPLWCRWEATKRIIRPVRIPSLFPALRTCMPTKCEMFAFSPQTWWLLNLFLVSFDKPPCSQRDIPLTQPLVIVYTSSHQSRRTLSGFDSNIHFASEVQYRKWLDHLSLFLQLLPPSSPTVFPLTLT